MPRCLRMVLPLFALLLISWPASPGDKQGGLVVDKDKRTITIDAKIAPRKVLEKIYPIEVIATWPAPKGQKAHETVVTFDIKPSEVHKAIESFGVKAGKPVKGEGTPEGPEVNIYLLLPRDGGDFRKVPIEQSVIDPRTGKNLPKLKWRFTGSAKAKPAADQKDTVYGADVTGTLITVFPVTDETVFQTNLTIQQEKFIKLETNTKLLPKEGTPVKLVIEVPK